MLVVTGGAGFLGSALLWQLNSRGVDEIIVVDNLGQSQKWRNLVKRKYVDYMHRDQFINLARENSLPWKVEAIVHMGACSSTTESDSDFLMENNFHYSRDLCEYALEHGARFIYASSAATYGAGERGFSDDPAIIPLLRPLNMYGYSKQLFDLWLLRNNLADSVCGLKFFNIYGPNEYHKGSMASVALHAFRQIKECGRVRLFESNTPSLENGAQQRDFTYVKDCARLMDWLLENPRVNGIRNVGTGHAASFRQLAEAVFEAMGMRTEIEYIPIPEEISRNYQNFTEADMGWLESLDYGTEFMPLEAGVADYVRGYLQKDDPWL